MMHKPDVWIDAYGHHGKHNACVEVETGLRRYHFAYAPEHKRAGAFHVGLFLNYHGRARECLLYPRKQRVLALLEPRASHYYREYPRALRRFACVLTHDVELLDKAPHVCFFPFGTNWLGWPQEELGRLEKSKMVSFMGAPHPEAPKGSGHALRNEVIEYLLERGGVDCFGKGIRWIDHTVDSLRDYRFSIVMENCQQDVYFTEKLLNCFLTDTVPIYWGCEGIGQCFDERGLLRFSTVDELKAILDDLNEERYEAMLPFVRANRDKAIAEKWMTMHHLHERLASVLDKQELPQRSGFARRWAFGLGCALRNRVRRGKGVVMLKNVDALVNRAVQHFSLPGWVSGYRYVPCVMPEVYAGNLAPEAKQILAPAQKMHYPLPCNVASRERLSAQCGERLAFSFHDVPALEVEEAYALTVEGGRLLYERGEWESQFFSFVTAQGQSLLHPGMGYRPGHRHALRSEPIHVKRGVCILGAWMNNFYLWHTMYVCRLMRVLELGLQDMLILPEPECLKPYARETLKTLGIEAVASIGPNSPHVEVEALTLIHDNPYRGEQLRAFREKVLPGKAKPWRKLYISRCKAPYRHLTNGVEVEACFCARGWEVHCMEDYPFARQVQLMGECVAIAGLHGAGFANMVFMPRGGQVLEISIGERPNANFYALASALGCGYWLSLARAAGVKPSVAYDDATADVASLEGLLAAFDNTIHKQS